MKIWREIRAIALPLADGEWQLLKNRSDTAYSKRQGKIDRIFSAVAFALNLQTPAIKCQLFQPSFHQW
ncbi:MAG: hypothetical protein DCF25_08455 [Leptolyngbya foveolarum]|uniref:Uncharacterized protein n=1 Tax=Leptolyngbya foveolarum TaxID=47253 RepID=A0A2W4UDZ6_9CYAN|nr:MAG: hypothetical protein DCF25_08455 [Leptolyngbya foveolarum]